MFLYYLKPARIYPQLFWIYSYLLYFLLSCKKLVICYKLNKIKPLKRLTTTIVWVYLKTNNILFIKQTISKERGFIWGTSRSCYFSFSGSWFSFFSLFCKLSMVYVVSVYLPLQLKRCLEEDLKQTNPIYLHLCCCSFMV